MALFRSRTAAGAAAALILLTGAPASAAAPAATGTLRKVALDTADVAEARPMFINRRGEIAGYLVDPDINGGARPVIWRQYDQAIDLGRPGEPPAALNNRGDVLGADWIWSNGQVRILEHPSSRRVWATGINDHGQVAGTVEGDPISLTRAFRWQDGQFTDLGIPREDTWTTGVAVNNRGAVLGWINEPLRSPVGGFVWRNGAMTVFGTDLYTITPKKINARNEVLSWGQALPDGSVHPYLWRNGRLIDLMADRPGVDGVAQDLNNAGDVVGSIDSRPVLWRDGRTIHLLPREWRGGAIDINERGDIAGGVNIGTGEDVDTRAFLLRDGRLYLSARETGRFTGVQVVGMDERGRIVGSLQDVVGGTGDARAFVWIPW
jgi:probable HAF family extracellular repeat protein